MFRGARRGTGIGITLPLVDEYKHDDLLGWLTPFLFGGGGDAARNVLATIAGPRITVTPSTFSLTVVTSQLASSQFSPRLPPTFSSDRFVQSTLAPFLGTFTFSVTVLRRSAPSPRSGSPAAMPVSTCVDWSVAPLNEK